MKTFDILPTDERIHSFILEGKLEIYFPKNLKKWDGKLKQDIPTLLAKYHLALTLAEQQLNKTLTEKNKSFYKEVISLINEKETKNGKAKTN